MVTGVVRPNWCCTRPRRSSALRRSWIQRWNGSLYYYCARAGGAPVRATTRDLASGHGRWRRRSNWCYSETKSHSPTVANCPRIPFCHSGFRPCAACCFLSLRQVVMARAVDCSRVACPWFQSWPLQVRSLQPGWLLEYRAFAGRGSVVCVPFRYRSSVSADPMTLSWSRVSCRCHQGGFPRCCCCCYDHRGDGWLDGYCSSNNGVECKPTQRTVTKQQQ